MPFKSKAQRRKFAELLVKGDITPETYEEWNRETGGAKLPERVQRAKSRAKPRRSTTRAKASRPTSTRSRSRKKSRPRKK